MARTTQVHSRGGARPRVLVLAIVAAAAVPALPSRAAGPVPPPTFSAKIMVPQGSTPNPFVRGTWDVRRPGRSGLLSVRGATPPGVTTLVTAEWTSAVMSLAPRRPAADISLSAATFSTSSTDRLVVEVRFRSGRSRWGPWRRAVDARTSSSPGRLGTSTGWTWQPVYDGTRARSDVTMQVRLVEHFTGAAPVTQTLEVDSPV